MEMPTYLFWKRREEERVEKTRGRPKFRIKERSTKESMLKKPGIQHEKKKKKCSSTRENVPSAPSFLKRATY